MSAVDLEVGKADFDFYAKFAKPLILSLINTEDRILAAAWFSKLRDEDSGPEKLRLDYLKLLLFVLQRHRLAGPFTENPNIEETLQSFGDNYDLPTIARQIIEKEHEDKKEMYHKRMRGEIGDFTPFSTDYSPDLKEYVAAQDIPNFGVHVYYAISKDPILDWDNAHHAVFTKAMKRMEPQGHLSETSFAIMEPKDEEDETDKCKILEETGVMPDETYFSGVRRERERKSPYVYMDRPAPALGILPGEGEAEVIEDKLPPPTWGSNLIEVREPIDMERPDTAAEQEDQQQAGATEVTSPRLTSMEAKEADPEDPEIVELLETSFNMEDILAEVDALETEDLDVAADFLEENDEFAIAENNFQEMTAILDAQDAAIAAAISEMDEDERRMLADMEAADEEAAAKKSEPKQEVKVLADEDTVIKVLVEEPGSKKETAKEKERKAAKKADDKKKKPAGRTGLNKSKVKGAILKESEKKALEQEEKKAKVVATKTGKPAGGPAKRPGVPKTKPTSSKTKVVETASTGKIPSATSSDTTTSKTGIRPPGSGIPTPGRGIPRPAGSGIPTPGRGIPRPAGSGIPTPGRGIPRPAGSGIPTPGRGIPQPAESGIPRPGGTGIPRPGGRGIPRPAGRGIPRPGAATPQNHMDIMKARLQQMVQDTRQAFPEEFIDERADTATPRQAAAVPESTRRTRLSPIQEESMLSPTSPGSPESDDIFEEMEREFVILERLCELYEELAPDVPDVLRTPPLFSKHPSIKKLGRKLRYRAKEFDINPMEQFEPAEQFFAGQVEPSQWVDPRELRRQELGETVQPDVAEQSPSRQEVSPPEQESPPWGTLEDLKKICERAEKRVDTSPAITAGIGITTPKSPATPRRPARRDLRLEFDLESPPPYESPPVSPEPVKTPEFVRINRFDLPKVISEEELQKIAAERYPEYEAYLNAEIQAERDIWGKFAPGASPEVVQPAEPIPVPVTAGYTSPQPGPSSRITPPPPSRSPAAVEQQKTPEQLPPEYQYQYKTPPRLLPTPMPEIPGSPVFEPFDPLQHEDIMLQVPPDLVEAELDEFEQVHGSPQIQIQDWFDPLQFMAEEADFDLGLDLPEEMMPDLVEFEEPPSPPPSPMTILRQKLREHEIEPEFFDEDRPLQKSKRVMVKSRNVRIPRTSRPTRLAKQTIEEDDSGEQFELDEELMEQEVAKEQEQKFMEMVIDEPERVEHLREVIESAETGQLPTAPEFPSETPPVPFPPTSPIRSPERSPPPTTPIRSPERSPPPTTPIRSPQRPVKPVVTPPLPPSREQLMFHGTPERVDARQLLEEELEFLASPGLPSPPTPPAPSPEIPSPPPRGLLMWDSPPGRGMLFDEEMDDFMLASPEMPKGRTLEDEFRELGTPTRLPPPFWTQPPAPSPAARSPPRVSPKQEAFMRSPVSPEIDSEALKRELRAHQPQYRKAHAGGFRAGKRWVGRRSARNYQLIPIVEQLDYEGSKKMPTPAKDYHVMLHKLPPAPPPAPYPTELMDVPHGGKFFHPDTLIDQPIPFEDELPEPIEPEWQVYGWRTPPRLRPRGAQEPARSDAQPYAQASHGRDVLLFEEPPEGIYLPFDEEAVPLELMGEGFVSPPARPRPAPSVSPQIPLSMMQTPPSFAIPSMTMSQQMMQAAQMAQWQAEQLASPPKPSPERISPSARMPSPSRTPQTRQPSPPAPHWSPQPAPSSEPHLYPYAPPSPSRQPIRQPSPPAPHWSPQPGTSSMPHVYPYAPPSPPRQQARQPSPPAPHWSPQPGPSSAPPSPPRQPFPQTQASPQRMAPVSPPRITKRVTEVKYTSQVYDPDSPEASKKWTKGRTMLQFNRPIGDQRPVQTPRSQGVAVYGTGAPASAADYSSFAALPPMETPERAPRRKPAKFKGRIHISGDTPTRRGERLPRRRILEGEIDQGQLRRRNLLGEFMGEELQQPEPLSPPQQVRPVSSASAQGLGAVQGERIEVMEEYVETEHDFIPEHLQGFRWMDEPENEYYSSFRQQFQR